jgi:ankyrin repeat protein
MQNRDDLGDGGRIVEMSGDAGAQSSKAASGPQSSGQALSQFKVDRALLEGARDQDMAKVRMALDLAARIDSKGKRGDAAIHHAAMNDDSTMVEELAKRGADIEARNDSDETPLNLGSRLYRHQAMRALLAAGADPSSVNTGKLPLEAFMHRESQRPVDAALLAAVRQGDGDKARMALALGADPDFVAYSKAAVIHAAAEANPGHPKMIKLLVQGGADVDARNSNGMAALHLAASKSRLDVVTALIELGADVHVQNHHGETPLHSAAAACRPSVDVFSALIAAGADPAARDREGMSPLATLIDCKRHCLSTECLEAMLPSSDLLRLDKKGRSVAEVAYENGYAEAGMLIEQHAANQAKAALSSPKALEQSKPSAGARLRM